MHEVCCNGCDVICDVFHWMDCSMMLRCDLFVKAKFLVVYPAGKEGWSAERNFNSPCPPRYRPGVWRVCILLMHLFSMPTSLDCIEF